MKPIKGLYLNSAIDDIPEGYTAFCRNAIINFKDGAVIKEKGFTNLNQQLPYKHIGTIETADETFFFSTDDKNSAISRFKNEQLETIIDDKYKRFKFGFKIANPIKGTAIKNYKDEWIICWIDLLNPIRILSTVNPTVQVEDDLLLFPQYVNPTVQVEVQQGGSLDKGAYIPFIRYSDLEQTYTDFIPIGKPVYIGEKIDKEITGKQVLFTFTNLDQDYKYFELGFYTIKNGVIRTYVSSKQTIGIASTYTLANISQLDDLSPEQLLINAPYYKQATAITQYEDQLCLAGVEEYEEINYQQWANNIKVRCKSRLIDNIGTANQVCTNINDESVRVDNKTFAHNEVYALYVALVLTNGRKTKAFTIPAEPLNLEERSVYSLDSCYKKYQVESTCSVIDRNQGLVKLGSWENENELYPDLPEFGVNRKQRVRHFRFPTIAFCKANLYASNRQYGISTLDQLGIYVENVIIPESLQTKVIGYEIYYAKRTSPNQLVLGQAISLYGTFQATPDTGAVDGHQSIINIQSAGGNWNTNWDGTSGDVYAHLKILRLNSFDLQFYKPALSNVHLLHELKLKKVIVPTDHIQIDADKIATIFDYTVGNVISILSPQRYDKVKNYTYLPSGAYTGNYDNRTLENTFVVELTNAQKNIVLDTIDRNGDEVDGVDFEETLLTTINTVKANVYLNFYEQDLVYTGQIHTTTTSSVMYTGDAFISDYSFVTYGVRESNDLNAQEGNRYVHRHLTESNGNANLRYQLEGNIYSNYYPVSNGQWLKNLDRSIDPNQYGYNAEFAKTYDISKMTPYNPFDGYIVVKHSNRVVISAKESREKGKRSWKTFYPLDYVEIKKQKGKIVDIHSFDRHLLIRTEHSAFINQNIQSLGNEEEIFLKSLNLTEQTFVEIFDDEKGIVGASQRFSSYLTPIGLFMVDQKAKNLYLYKGGLKKVNGTLNSFFKNHLTETGDNPFQIGGFHINYDPQFDRILFTQKGVKSYTLSHTIGEASMNWACFHDYIPDSFFSQRQQLYSIKSGKLFRHNTGQYGKYYDNQVKPFVIDVPFRSDKPFVTNTARWTTVTEEEFKTITHIAIYNTYQCTGRIPIVQASWINKNIRKLKAEFHFDYLRNELNLRVNNFLSEPYQFREINSSLLGTKEWHKKEELSGKFIVVRLEDNNNTNSELSLLDVGVTVEQAVR